MGAEPDTFSGFQGHRAQAGPASRAALSRVAEAGSSVLSRPCRWPWLCFCRVPSPAQHRPAGGVAAHTVSMIPLLIKAAAVSSAG